MQQLCREWNLLGSLGQWQGPPYFPEEWDLWQRCRASRRPQPYPQTQLDRLRTNPWDEYPYSDVQRRTTTVRMSNFQRWISTIEESSIEPLADGNVPTKRLKRLKNDWNAMNDKRFFVDFEDPEALGWLQISRIFFVYFPMPVTRSRASRLDACFLVPQPPFFFSSV